MADERAERALQGRTRQRVRQQVRSLVSVEVADQKVWMVVHSRLELLMYLETHHLGCASFRSVRRTLGLSMCA